MVGETLDPVYTALVDLAQSLGIRDLIHWKGLVPFGKDLFELYRRADVFVLPSYSEGFPKAIREAMANCCPVIATDVGGVQALLTHGEQALLIPPKDPDAIAQAVTRLLSDEGLRHHMIEQAYSHALHYSVEACARRLALTLTEVRNWNE
jgi:glycosyltransferase involved in cell wall biosynthesis